MQKKPSTQTWLRRLTRNPKKVADKLGEDPEKFKKRCKDVDKFFNKLDKEGNWDGFK